MRVPLCHLLFEVGTEEGAQATCAKDHQAVDTLPQSQFRSISACQPVLHFWLAMSYLRMVTWDMNALELLQLGSL